MITVKEFDKLNNSWSHRITCKEIESIIKEKSLNSDYTYGDLVGDDSAIFFIIRKSDFHQEYTSKVYFMPETEMTKLIQSCNKAGWKNCSLEPYKVELKTDIIGILKLHRNEEEVF